MWQSHETETANENTFAHTSHDLGPEKRTARTDLRQRVVNLTRTQPVHKIDTTDRLSTTKVRKTYAQGARYNNTRGRRRKHSGSPIM